MTPKDMAINLFGQFYILATPPADIIHGWDNFKKQVSLDRETAKKCAIKCIEFSVQRVSSVYDTWDVPAIADELEFLEKVRIELENNCMD